MIKNIVNYVNHQGRFITSSEIIENSLWFTVSSLLGLLQPKVIINGRVVPLNYFGITIAGSSAGKSFALQEIIKLFEIDKRKIAEAIRGSFISVKNPIEIYQDNEKIPLQHFLPNDFYINIEGTAEGLYLRALALSNAWCGSLNVVNEEILDIIKDSTLNRMKELYDGRYNAKVIKSEINENIEGLNANMLIFGSSIGIKRSQSTYNLFNQALSSGIYRRSFIYYEEPRQIEVNRQNDFIYNALEEAIQNVKRFINKRLEARRDGNDFVIDTSHYDFSPINDLLIEFSNKNIDDERFGAEIGSFDKIVKLAVLHSVLTGGSGNINDDDISYAYDFYTRCRNTVQELFNTEPPHKRIYKILKKYGEFTKSEILEKDIFQRSTFNEDIQLVEELAYRNNERVVQRGRKIKKYSIEPLPATDLSKIIVSLGLDHKGARTTNFGNYEMPFFGDNISIERLVKSDRTDCFCLVHFKDGKRKSSNAIEGQNAIAFDFDGGSTIEYAQDLLKPFTYILYTTKSHTNGNHRFRVILPTKHKFFVNPEQHKGLLTNIADLLGLPTFDVSTRNIDRLWFTNPRAVVLKNEGDLLDVLCCIPDTEAEKHIARVQNEDIDDISKDKRITGMIKWTIANGYKGNRNHALYRLFSFVKDLSGSIDEASEVVYRTNAMLDEPLPEGEVLKITRRR